MRYAIILEYEIVRLFFILDAYELVWIHCETRWEREERDRLPLGCGMRGWRRKKWVYEKYKNKCVNRRKQPRQEGTINCYMEADACVELQIIAFILFRLLAIVILWFLLSIIAKYTRCGKTNLSNDEIRRIAVKIVSISTNTQIFADYL